MNSKERHEFYSKIPEVYQLTDTQVVQHLVNTLIEALYIPAEGFDNITKVDQLRLRYFRIEDEGINWGDFKCNSVSKFADGSFLATIDEAAPGCCPTFCDYIERYMDSYGWKVKAETEW